MRVLRIELDDRDVWLSLSAEEEQRVMASLRCVCVWFLNMRRRRKRVRRIWPNVWDPNLERSRNAVRMSLPSNLACEDTSEYDTRNHNVGYAVLLARHAMSRGNLAEVGAFICVYEEANVAHALDDIIAEMKEWVAKFMSGQVVSEEVPALEANTVASCFLEGLLDPLRPNQLFLLLLAMRARRRWMGREIPAFVEKVRKEFPELEQFYGKTVEQLVWSIHHLQNKATHHFFDLVHDQGSMVRFINEELYPKKKDGDRRKESKKAQELAEKLYMRL